MNKDVPKAARVPLRDGATVFVRAVQPSDKDLIRAGFDRLSDKSRYWVDGWHGRGLGTVLLELLTERAREEGIETLSALMLSTNAEMLDLLRRLGAMHVSERKGSCLEVETELPPAGVHPGLRELLRRSADPASGVRPAKRFAPDEEPA